MNNKLGEGKANSQQSSGRHDATKRHTLSLDIFCRLFCICTHLTNTQSRAGL